MYSKLAIAALALWLTPSLLGAAEKTVAHQVPYRLADTNHLVVRAKINGKGPFNFIVDTGAPSLYLTTAVAKKAGVKPDKNGWGTLDRLMLEGGPVLEKARGKVEDVPQIAGMNSLGAAGIELHGLLGYNILARFRIEYDLTSTKMTWTLLDHKADVPERMGKGAPPSLEAMGSILKVAGFLMGRSPEPKVEPRGFIGIELGEGGGVSIAAVLPNSPAARAGLQPGDRLTHFQDMPVSRLSDLGLLSPKIKESDAVRITVLRGDAIQHITVKAGKGL